MPNNDKKVTLNFNYDDGTTDTVDFIVPAGADGEAGADGQPISICDMFDTLPEADTMGTEPKLIAQIDGECRVVTMPNRGLFTDIRVEGRFIGVAVKGGTNNGLAIVRNLSLADAGEVMVYITHPTQADLTVGTTTVLFNTLGTTTVTLEDETRAGRTYKIQNLKGGAEISFVTAYTYGSTGTHNSSVQVVGRPEMQDVSADDDTASFSYFVYDSSSTAPSVDCPPFGVTIRGYSVPVVSVPPNGNIGTIDVSATRLAVLEEDGTLELVFSRAVTVRGEMGLDYAVAWDADERRVLPIPASSALPMATSNLVAVDETNTRFRVTPITTQFAYTSILIRATTGAGCREQYFVVYVRPQEKGFLPEVEHASADGGEIAPYVTTVTPTVDLTGSMIRYPNLDGTEKELYVTIGSAQNNNNSLVVQYYPIIGEHYKYTVTPVNKFGLSEVPLSWRVSTYIGSINVRRGVTVPPTTAELSSGITSVEIMPTATIIDNLTTGKLTFTMMAE